MKDGETPPTRPLPPVSVSGINSSNDTIDFDVDHPGTPVLVKVSYFPNWKVDGARGPFRVTPNLMVVIPTANHVHLHYGNTSVEYMAWFLTLLGIALAVFVARRKPLNMPEPVVATEGFFSRILERARLADEEVWDEPIWDTDRPPDEHPSPAAMTGPDSAAAAPPDEEQPSPG